MKKSKVNKLIQKAKTDAYCSGLKDGKNEQKLKYESIRFPERGDYTWLEGPPKNDTVIMVIPRGYYDPVFVNPENMSCRMMDFDQRLEFKLKIKGIALANGVMIRWADWEPYGPYKVTDFSMPPGYR